MDVDGLGWTARATRTRWGAGGPLPFLATQLKLIKNSPRARGVRKFRGHTHIQVRPVEREKESSSIGTVCLICSPPRDRAGYRKNQRFYGNRTLLSTLVAMLIAGTQPPPHSHSRDVYTRAQSVLCAKQTGKLIWAQARDWNLRRRIRQSSLGEDL